MQRGRGGVEMMASLVPVVFGAALAIVGAVDGSRRNVLVGVALVCTGVVGLIAPRLVPPPPGLGRERLRARRTAAVILPNGVIYIVLGILLRTVIPASERGGTTTLIALFAVVMGLLSILSGLGALARARRPDDGSPRTPMGAPSSDAERGNG